MDEYIITSVQHDWLCIHTPIPELCNAIQITGQMPFRFYIIHLHVNISISFNVTLVFHCLLLALCDDGCSGVLNRVYAQRLYVLPSSQNLTTREQCHAQLKNEIMNGNQKDHKTFVWTLRRSKQRLIFCRTFHQYIQHHDADADAEHRHTPRNPDVTLLKQAGWYWVLGFEF